LLFTLQMIYKSTNSFAEKWIMIREFPPSTWGLQCLVETHLDS
jgi:hypothetical protein